MKGRRDEIPSVFRVDLTTTIKMTTTTYILTE